MKLKEEYYLDIEKQLINYFYETYFLPLWKAIEEPYYNSFHNSISDVINAIRKGQIVIQGDVITGAFNLKISKELKKFASFNSHTKKWFIKDKTIIPTDILGASIVANEKTKQLHERLKSILDDTTKKSKDKLKDINFDISKQAKKMDGELAVERIKLGIEYLPKDEIRENLTKQYNDNMKLSIVNEVDPSKSWDDIQLKRLHEMIEKSSLEGFNRNKLIDMIQSEFQTSENKAKFLARNETSLFLSNLTNERFIDAGIKWYLWLNSGDVRVVGNPIGIYKIGSEGHGNHWIMKNKVCRFDDSTIYADNIEGAKQNIWKKKSNIGADDRHAGESYNCRCVKRVVIV